MYDNRLFNFFFCILLVATLISVIVDANSGDWVIFLCSSYIIAAIGEMTKQIINKK